MQKRIEHNTSRTAEINCVVRAISFYERDERLRCADSVAPLLLPGRMQPFLRFGALRLFYRAFAPKGIYEYVAVRTKYIDQVIEKAGNQLEQVLIFGAGFDSRAVRFDKQFSKLRFYELDSPPTQEAKRAQYQKRGITTRAVYIPIDFDRESIQAKLDAEGFQHGLRTLFLLEGLTMYLQPESIDATFRLIAEYAGAGSVVVFDFIRSGVLTGTEKGSGNLTKVVSRHAEPFTFGMEPAAVPSFLAQYGMALTDLSDAAALEKRYLGSNTSGRINDLHVLVTAQTN